MMLPQEMIVQEQRGQRQRQRPRSPWYVAHMQAFFRGARSIISTEGSRPLHEISALFEQIIF